jgi:peptidoglycan/xylan/chitin deacetylase (PgdA/CDA1 family)
MWVKNYLRNNYLIQRGLSYLIEGKDQLVVLTFHNIASNEFSWFHNAVTLLSKEYQFIDPDNFDFFEKSNKKQLLITFDDGYMNQKIIAENFLNPLGIKALFFIPYDFVGLKGESARLFCQNNFFPQSKIKMLNNEFDAMNWEDIVSLSDHGHTIGGHTFSHPILSKINSKDLKYEIVDSSKKIEAIIKKSIQFFAYPFGSKFAVNELSIEMAKSHFKFSFLNKRGFVSESNSCHEILRQNISPGMDISEIRNIIKGRYNNLLK